MTCSHPPQAPERAPSRMMNTCFMHAHCAGDMRTFWLSTESPDIPKALLVAPEEEGDGEGGWHEVGHGEGQGLMQVRDPWAPAAQQLMMTTKSSGAGPQDLDLPCNPAPPSGASDEKRAAARALSKGQSSRSRTEQQESPAAPAGGAALAQVTGLQQRARSGARVVFQGLAPVMAPPQASPLLQGAPENAVVQEISELAVAESAIMFFEEGTDVEGSGVDDVHGTGGHWVSAPAVWPNAMVAVLFVMCFCTALRRSGHTHTHAYHVHTWSLVTLAGDAEHTGPHGLSELACDPRARGGTSQLPPLPDPVPAAEPATVTAAAEEPEPTEPVTAAVTAPG